MHHPMLRFASSPATYEAPCRLLVRNEPQHDHASKIYAPLIGFSLSKNIVSFAITNVAVRKLTSNLYQAQPTNYDLIINHFMMS